MYVILKKNKKRGQSQVEESHCVTTAWAYFRLRPGRTAKDQAMPVSCPAAPQKLCIPDLESSLELTVDAVWGNQHSPPRRSVGRASIAAMSEKLLF